ncbi:MAG: hypothetical protein WAN35_20340 [Terracidiphilus sp.]
MTLLASFKQEFCREMVCEALVSQVYEFLFFALLYADEVLDEKAFPH